MSYFRPAGVSSLHDDEFVIYQAALVMPGSIGAAIWGRPNTTSALALIHANVDLRFLRLAYKKLEIPDESLDFGR